MNQVPVDPNQAGSTYLFMDNMVFPDLLKKSSRHSGSTYVCSQLQTAPSAAECTSFEYLKRAPRLYFGSGAFHFESLEDSSSSVRSTWSRRRSISTVTWSPSLKTDMVHQPAPLARHVRPSSHELLQRIAHP